MATKSGTASSRCPHRSCHPGGAGGLHAHQRAVQQSDRCQGPSCAPVDLQVPATVPGSGSQRGKSRRKGRRGKRRAARHLPWFPDQASL